MPDLTHDEEGKKRLLAKAERIAVVGASPDPSRPSHRIFEYLRDRGYDALPVTPKPDPVLGVPPVSDLKAAAGKWSDPIDIVDIFRNRDATLGVVEEAIAAGAKAVWFQLTTDHPDAVQAALDAGLDVVADQCIMVEHRRLFT